MGIFKDAFGLGAGATLGNMSVQMGYNAVTGIVNTAEEELYTKFRSQNFDPIVRQDLNDIIVRGALEPREYPFPENKTERRKNFFMRHKVFWIITGIYFFGISILAKTEMFDVMMNFAGLYGVYAMIYVAIALGKKVHRGGKALLQVTFKSKLMEAGRQYWYMREYIRQALQTGELSIEDAIRKISNTELGCQFPDTVDQIEANAFFYRQRLGL